MNNIKVYLQYPWKFPDSPYYKYLIDNPPKGIEYLNVSKQKGVITNKRIFLFSNLLKNIIRKTLNIFSISIPSAFLSKSKENYDLIHCAHCLSKNKDKNWVADIESEWQFYLGKRNNSSIKGVKEILSRNNCKKIMPWTQYTANQIIETFPFMRDKVEVVHPALPVQESKKEKGKKITLLYATRYFWLKGGVIALEVCKRLNEKYREKIEIIFISDVPTDIKHRYRTLKIKDIVPLKELFGYYKKADLFFYPSFIDTFGFGILEAMSFGLPIISVNTNKTLTRKEILDNGKQGFISEIKDQLTDKILEKKEKLVFGKEENELIENLFENCCKLIDDKKLREKMSRNCTNEVKNGKFSIKERNKKLKRIYEEAIK